MDILGVAPTGGILVVGGTVKFEFDVEGVEGVGGVEEEGGTGEET